MNPHKIALFIIGFSFAALSLNSYSDTFYKWKDANNNTHYGSNPPKGVNATTVRTSNRASGPVKKMAPTNNQENNNSTENSSEGSTAYDATKVAKYCGETKKRLNLITSSNQIKQRNKDGSVVMLSEEKRQAQIQQLNDNIKEHCQ